MSRHALLVAVGEYEDPRLNALRAPQQDVTRLAAVLEDPAVGGFDSVRVVVDASDHEIRSALEDTLADRSPDDLVLVYFSCHGIKTPQQRLYFAASNTRQDRPAGSAVARTFVNELFEDCRAAGRVLLLDCCFSGAYGKGIKAAGGSVLDDRGGEGYIVLTASNAFEYAFEEDQLSLEAPHASVFTDVLLEGLSSGAADLNGDGWIDVQELFNYVHREVTSRRRDQTPKFFAHGADAGIRIARAGSSQVIAPQVTAPMYTPQQMLVARGFKAAAEPICRTLGPWGRRAVVLAEDGRYVELSESATIAEAFQASDPRDELGASYVRELVRAVHRQAGDGATTGVVVAQALIVNLLEAMRAGAHPIRLRRGLDRAQARVVEHLERRARPIAGAEEVAQLATACSGDPEIGGLIGDAITRVGTDGPVIVEEGSRLGAGLEVVGGIRFDAGYLSGQFITDTERQVAELEDPYVLVCQGEISAVKDLLPVLEKVMRTGKPLLVVATDVTGSALATLVVNKARETFKSVAVRRSGGSSDVAVLTGARVLAVDRLEKAELTQLGTARKVVVGEHETTVIIDDARGTGRACVLTVGALTESALAERRRRAERAVLAVRIALAHGVVEGGRVALGQVADTLETADPAAAALADALRRPLRRIAENAAFDPGVSGAPDPVGVLIAAVFNAVSTANRFLLLG